MDAKSIYVKKKSQAGTYNLPVERKTIPDVEAMETPISDLRSQLDRAAQIIVAKDNDLERLDKKKDKLQQAYNGAKQRMRQIGGSLWKERV